MIIGVDCGKKGGIGVIFADGGCETVGMPSDRDFYWLMEGYLNSAKMNGEKIVVCVEQVFAMSKQQKQTEYVEHSGAIKQTLRILGIPFETVHPCTWKKKLKLTNDKKASLALVRDLFGDAVKYLKDSQDGEAEALLIAKYYQRYVLKGE